MTKAEQLSEEAKRMCAGCVNRLADGRCYWPWVSIKDQNDRVNAGNCDDATLEQGGKLVSGYRVLVGGAWVFQPKLKA